MKPLSMPSDLIRIALLIALVGVVGSQESPAQSLRTPEMQKELDQLAQDFNIMYGRHSPIKVLLNGHVRQMQTFQGLYEKNKAGDYVQKNICETLTDTGFAPVGAADGEQCLTMENGAFIVKVVYQYKGGPPRPCPNAAVKRLGNGIVFQDFDLSGNGGWRSNEFYFARDGRHETIRRFKGESKPDLFAEVDVPAPAVPKAATPNRFGG